MASQPALIQPGQPSSNRPPVVVCDHAVFSSVRTVVGRGYQIVAASKGISPAEKKDITARSPSHGGLCEDGPEATAVAFYKLGSGRLALAFSCDGGAEHTGRGVRRIYTHITVISPEDFARFRFNASNVLLSVDETGWLDVQLQPPRVLEPLRLNVADRFTGQRVAGAVENYGADWITATMGTVLQGKRVVVGGDFDPGDWIEAVLTGVPGPRRLDISFSAGLRFAVGRAYTISAVTGDLRQTRRLVKGQRLEYVEPGPDRHPPRPNASSWLRMVDRCYREGRIDAVLALTTVDLPDHSDAALDRIGTICDATALAATASTRDLLALADRYIDARPPNEFESELQRQLLSATQEQMGERLRSEPEVKGYWPALSGLARRSRAAADFALSPISTVLSRLAFNAPVTAAAYAVEAVEAASEVNAVERLRSAQSTILDGLRAWLPVATPDELDRARSVLHEWQYKLPGSAAASHLLDQIEQRLADAR